jgi:hypothetical protein
MLTLYAAPPPTATDLGAASVAVGGDNRAPINTGTMSTTVVVQIAGDDAEKNVSYDA